MSSKKHTKTVHRIFELCAAYTTDEGWVDFLKECSLGKFPRGVKFENGAIKCKRKQLTFTEYLPKEPENAIKVILNVFGEKLKEKTVREKKAAGAKFDKEVNDQKIQSWKEARTISVKNSLIRNYVDFLSVHYAFSSRESIDMTCLIELALASGTLAGDKIKIQDSRIINIEGLQFDPFTRKSSLQSKIPEIPVILYPLPLNYEIKPQLNLTKRNALVLDYHLAKVHREKENQRSL